MNLYKIVIADNEPNAISDLVRLLDSDPEFKVIGQAVDGTQALAMVRELKPDAVFLDIEMPGLNGIEVALQLAVDPKPPLVVFSTAFDQYAMTAFDANAVDYLLKPCSKERMKKALEKIKSSRGAGNSESVQGLEGAFLREGRINRIIGRDKAKKEKIVLDPAEIDFFQTKWQEVFARYKGQDLSVNLTLKELTTAFEKQGFTACHKSYLVNLNHILKIKPILSGNYEITIKDAAETKVPLSRRFAQPVLARLGI